ncbi:MAG: hypothetical protein LUF00_00125 [Lachnospiraceae bacterium]|nr:hypothetical protein [Lachnospiraceae bacterium]
MEEAEQTIQIWTSGLSLAVVVGMAESFLFQDIRGYREFGGKAPNVVTDFIEKSSEKIAVLLNDIFGIMFLGTLSSFICIIYMFTKVRWLVTCSIILSVCCLLSTIVTILAFYFQSYNKRKAETLPRISNPELLTMLIELLLLAVTNESTVGAVYECLYDMKDTIQTILVIIVVLCYTLALAFCHFFNLYCLIAIYFINQDGRKIQGRIDQVMQKNKKREDALRDTTDYVDKKAEQVGLSGIFLLGFYYLYYQMRSYCLSRKYDIEYLFLLLKFKIIRLLGGLFEKDRLKINSIRFCEIMTVLELLLLDMFLFAYLGDSAICSRFFELLSTVIIIPILLSSLATLKSSKRA